MIAFGRLRVPLVAAAVALVLSASGGGDPPASVQALEADPTTSTTSRAPRSRPSTAAPATDATGSTSTTSTSETTGVDGTTSTTGDDDTTTTTRRTTTTTTKDGRTTTTAAAAPTTAPATTTTAASPCPTGGIAWDVTFDATAMGDDKWRIDLGGALTNTASAAIEVTAVTGTVAVTSADGAARTEQVRASSSPRTIGPGGRANVSGSATIRSSNDPSYRGTSVSARWADSGHASRCRPPS